MKFLFRTVPRYRLRRAVTVTGCTLLLFAGAARPAELATESYRAEPMPPGIRVVATELEGPVFADSAGKTLYAWPQHKLRNGYSGEAAGTPACYGEATTVSAGLMSPYPAGVPLPALDSRPACTDLWRPLLAPMDAEEIGKWTVVARRDGTRQWAHAEQPLYTSVRDRQSGDTFGGSRRKQDNDAPAGRVPAGPATQMPPGFAVTTVSIGRMLTTAENDAVYAFADDTATSTACEGDCLRRWEPVPAPALARQQDQWTILERAPGVRQWVFRGEPLYTHRYDRHSWSQEGSDEAGWHNVFTQRSPAFPDTFTVQASLAGNVLADASGRTIYTYQCGDDSRDQLACDHPDDTQVYRLAVCGGGDPTRCLEFWPYVTATPDAVSPNRTWSARWIDPQTGRFARENQIGAVRVWTYRDRPVYTFAGDRRPGDVNGDGFGEWRGKRNGLLAFFLRDDFMGSDL